MGSLCPFRRVGLLEEGCISKNYVIHLLVSVGTCHHCHHLLPIKVKPGVVWAEEQTVWIVSPQHLLPFVSVPVSCLCVSSTINYQ